MLHLVEYLYIFTENHSGVGVWASSADRINSSHLYLSIQLCLHKNSSLRLSGIMGTAFCAGAGWNTGLELQRDNSAGCVCSTAVYRAPCPDDLGCDWRSILYNCTGLQSHPIF